MSWDAYMMIDTGGESHAIVEDIRNVTYNNGALFRYLGCHPKDLEGMKGEIAKDLLITGLDLSHDPSRLEELKKLEPANGWGGLDDVQDFLQKAFEACKHHPKAYLHFS